LKSSNGREVSGELCSDYDVDMAYGSRWYTPDFHKVTLDIQALYLTMAPRLVFWFMKS
jgi:hypothetical protein